MLFQTEKFFRKEQQKIFFSRLFRKIFLEDWVMKLVALIITLALWFGVTGLREPITTPLKKVALQLRVSNNLEITNEPVTEITLVVTGDRRKIDQIKLENLIASMDLTDVQPDKLNTIPLTPETINVELPNGVKIDEIQPNKISVNLETVEEREVDVRPETEGNVAEGFEVYGKPTITPAKVRVRGPSSLVRQLKSVPTEKIKLDNRRGDFTAQQVPINVDPKITKLDGMVDVSFRIGEKRVEMVFFVPVATDEGTKRVKVILYGTRSVMENITSENLRVEFVKNEAGTLVPRVTLPPEIEGRVEIREPKEK